MRKKTVVIVDGNSVVNYVQARWSRIRSGQVFEVNVA